MPRSQRPIRRPLPHDPRYSSPLVTRFINNLVTRGKRSVAERVFYEAMELVGQRSGEDPFAVFNRAMNNVKPALEVKPRRVGGATYQVPVEVNRKRAQSLSIRWILEAARSKKGRPMADRLAGELLDAFKKEGAAITKRENTHKMAEANKAFAHYAW